MSRAFPTLPRRRAVPRVSLAAAAFAGSLLLGAGWARAQSPPGKGIADPKQWGTDWAKNQAKDAVFGKDISPDLEAIFKKLPDSVKSLDKQSGPCKPRALSEAWWAANELAHKRVVQGAGKTLFDILDDLVGLGTKELGEFLVSKGESEFRKWLAGKLAGQKPRGYEVTLKDPACSLHTITTWDPVAGTYRFTVIGDCHCRPVPLMGFKPAPVKAFLVVLEGPAEIGRSKDHTQLELHPGLAHLVHLSADCACDAQHASDAARLTLPGPKKATTTGGQTAKPKPVPAPAEGCAADDCRKDLDFLKELDGRSDLDTARWSLAIDRICDHWNDCKCGDKIGSEMASDEAKRKLFAKYCVNLKHHHAGDRRTGYLGPAEGEGEPVSDTGDSEIAAGEAGAVELRVGAPGHERPGVTVDFSGDDGRTVRKVTDGTGTVSLALAKGRYSVVVGGGGEPVRGTVEVEAGELSSYTAGPGGLSASREPLGDEVTPADATAAKGYGFSYRAQNDLVTIDLATPEGTIYVSAPGTVVEGSEISYGVLRVASGDSPRKREKNQAKLERYGVVVNDRDTDLTVVGQETGFHAGSRTTVELLYRGETTLAKGSVPFRTPESASVVRWNDEDTGAAKGTGSVLAGGAFGLPGHFDGDASNTRLTVGGKPQRVAAESTLAVYFYTPADAIGPLEVVAEDGGVTTTGTVNNLGLRFWADQTDLLRGQRTTCHVRVSGLEGLERPVYLALVNRTPGIISLAPADAQLLVLAPGGAGTPGTFQADRPMVGVTPGGFVITAAVTSR